MRWISETPCSIVQAWNNLCEAVFERGEYYQLKSIIRNPAYLIPDPPSSRRTFNIADMSLSVLWMIRTLVKYSYDWTRIGEWQNKLTFGDITSPEDPFFDLCPADGYAFFRAGRDIPSFRHTAAEFIKAAAQIVDFAVRYPAPTLAYGPNDSGFGVDAFLEGESFVDTTHITGSSTELISIQMPVNASPLTVIANDTLAIWAKDRGRGRAYGHRWRYIRGMGRNMKYKPVDLSGSCELRSTQRGLYSIGLVDDDPEIYDLGCQYFTMDLDSGTADRKLDLSPASDTAAAVWNTPETDPVLKKSVFLMLDEAEVRLSKDNFPPLEYKYMEKEYAENPFYFKDR